MADRSGEHVHWADDYRGRREVIIDGVPVTGVVYCDTKAGVAAVHDLPLKSTDGEHVDVHPVWGDVKVIFCGGYVQGGKTFRSGEGPVFNE